MIPPELVEFVSTAQYFAMATRDTRLHPCGARVTGARVDATTGLLHAFVPLASANGVVEAAQASGVAAVTMAKNSHECYQFKGDVAEVRPISDDETAVQDICFSRHFAALKEAGAPAEQWTFPPLRPAMTIVVRVKDIFLQTPGPNAGTRIGP
jgi:hypothetical protein